MRLVLATNNRHKVTEIAAKISPFGWEVVSLADIPYAPVVDEDRETFYGNAAKKAREIHAATGSYALADDSGLCVDALDGQPGVFSARFGGVGATDAEKNYKLLKLMERIPDNKRRAAFVCAMVLWGNDGEVAHVEGRCEGEIARQPKGVNGFGYDPIFYLPDRKLHMAELPLEEKNRISHRARAIEQMIPVIKNISK